jgi:Rad3-related DNA helicase
MNTPEANQLLEKLISAVNADGINVSVLVPAMKQLREFALKEEDPLITRALRLGYQHLEENDGFHLAFIEEAETQEENLSYFLELMLRAENKYNRDELREMTNMLQQMV